MICHHSNIVTTAYKVLPLYLGIYVNMRFYLSSEAFLHINENFRSPAHTQICSYIWPSSSIFLVLI